MHSASVAAAVEAGWLGVEIRHLVALRTLADERSFKAAAVRLGYTQSAVSQQIAMLERLVGQRLVERSAGGRTVSLTEAGRLLYVHAEAIAARLAGAKADLDALASGRAGVLRVGTFQTVGARMLPEALRRVLPDWPGVSVELTEEIADLELLALLEQGGLDLAFAVLPLPPGSFEWIELYTDPFVAATAAASPLARRDQVSFEELAALPLVCFRSCRVTEMALDQLRAGGHEPNVVFRSDHNETVQGAAAAGLGVALLPRLAADERDRRTRQLRIVPQMSPRVIAAVWQAGQELPPAAAALVDAALDVCGNLAALEQAG
jgi:DNA-binding transcriptional LysR family regulator